MKTTPFSELLTKIAALPWIVDDRHIHCETGFTNTDPRLMLESDIVAEVDTSCLDNGQLRPMDKAHLAYLTHCANNFPAVVSVLQRLRLRAALIQDLQHAGHPVAPELFSQLFEVTNEATALLDQVTEVKL